jgi:hypothetical protein
LRYLALLVGIAIVFVAVALLGGLVVLCLRWLGRHQSRTRDQQSTVYALNMALVGIVVASRECYDSVSGDGQGRSAPRGSGPWTATDARLRPAVERHLRLVEDVELKQLTAQLLDRTARLFATNDPTEAARLNAEIETLHEKFRIHRTDVVRALNVSRVSRGR